MSMFYNTLDYKMCYQKIKLLNLLNVVLLFSGNFICFFQVP